MAAKRTAIARNCVHSRVVAGHRPERRNPARLRSLPENADTSMPMGEGCVTHPLARKHHRVLSVVSLPHEAEEIALGVREADPGRSHLFYR